MKVSNFDKHWIGIVATLSCFISSVPAMAAEVRVLSSENGKPNIVILSGDLVLGDQKKFISQTLSLDAAIVVFESNGGNLIAGIEIGKAIRLKDFVTYVPADTVCASACAFAWLGGTKRLLSRSARIGFHAAFINERGVARESGMGNALAGAYLNQLGLPSRAISYITSAAPSDMTWLTITDAGNVGIDASIFDPQSAQKSQPSTSVDRQRQSTTIKPDTAERNNPIPQKAQPSPRVVERSSNSPACPADKGAYWDNCIGRAGGGVLATYHGEYKNNLREGRGTCTSADGSNTINGIWKHGNLSSRLSYGSNNSTYNANINCDQMLNWGYGK